MVMLLILTACGRPQPPDPSDNNLAEQPSQSQESPGTVSETQTIVQTRPSRPDPPTSVRIPALGVDAQIVPLGLDPDGAMASPDGPFEVGWYSPGARPGERGNVLLDGHVDWTNRQTGVPFGAVFWGLRQLGQGDEVYINIGDKSHKYIVEKTVVLPWDDPSGAGYLQNTDTPIATLITCGGSYDKSARNYSHRVVVVTRLAV